MYILLCRICDVLVGKSSFRRCIMVYNIFELLCPADGFSFFTRTATHF